MKINKHLIAISLLILLMISACKGNQWFRDRTSQETSEESGEVTPSSSSESEPDPIFYNVNFYTEDGQFTNGQTTISLTVESGSSIPNIGSDPIPNKQYYYFNNWYRYNDGEKIYIDYNDPVYSNLDFYAEYIQPDTTIFECLIPNSQILEEERKVVITVTDQNINSIDFTDKLVVSDYCSYDLYDNAGQSSPYPNKTLNFNGKREFELYIGLYNYNIDSMANYTLYVVRKYNVWVRYYDSDGALIDKEEINCTEEYQITKTISNREGQYFIAWAYDQEGYDRIWGGSVNAMQDVNVYAAYDYIIYTLYYDLDGGIVDGEMHENYINVSYESYYTLPVPHKDGFEFIGYFMGELQITDNTGYALRPWHEWTDTLLEYYSVAHYQAI